MYTAIHVNGQWILKDTSCWDHVFSACIWHIHATSGK